jgi:hypothetical protein
MSIWKETVLVFQNDLNMEALNFSIMSANQRTASYHHPKIQIVNSKYIKE